MRRIGIMMLVALICLSAFADEEKLRVAVFDPTSSGTSIDEGTKVAIREIISSAIVNAGIYEVVERSLLDKVMEEQEFSNSGMVDDKDAAKIGKIAGANKVVISVVTLTGGRNMLSVRMIDVNTASVDRQKVNVSSGELLDVVEPLTLALIGVDSDINTGKTVVPASQPSIGNRILNFRKKQQPTAKEDSKASVGFPEFRGCGVTFKSIGFSVGRQPDELSAVNMGRVLGCGTINVIIDFSDASVEGRNIMDFIESNIDYKTLSKFDSEIARLLEGLEEIKEYTFLYSPASPITLLVKVRIVDAKGKVNTSDFVLIDTNTQEVLSGMRITSQGGNVGSFPNLIGDAFEDVAGPKFLKQFKSAIKKAKKAR